MYIYYTWMLWAMGYNKHTSIYRKWLFNGVSPSQTRRKSCEFLTSNFRPAKIVMRRPKLGAEKSRNLSNATLVPHWFPLNLAVNGNLYLEKPVTTKWLCCQAPASHRFATVGGFSPTHLKNMIVNLDHFPKKGST